MSIHDPGPQREAPELLEEEDLFGPYSFPASDPPSTWWGGEPGAGS
jgi:hypothetical protein